MLAVDIFLILFINLKNALLNQINHNQNAHHVMMTNFKLVFVKVFLNI